MCLHVCMHYDTSTVSITYVYLNIMWLTHHGSNEWERGKDVTTLELRICNSPNFPVRLVFLHPQKDMGSVVVAHGSYGFSFVSRKKVVKPRKQKLVSLLLT